MLILLLAFLGGMLTLASPCILPVLPFVLAGSGRPFRRGALPLLAGMALTFALVATLAAFAGGWATRVNQAARLAALVALAVFGLALLWRPLAAWLARPFVALGNRLARDAAGRDSILGMLALGVATGLLWTPCAGPVLGLLLAGAALYGASLTSTLLLLTYALGAAAALALVLALGTRWRQAAARSARGAEWLRRALGALVLAGVTSIATGLDTGLLARLSLASTSGIEQGLIDALRPAPGMPDPAMPTLGAGDAMPALSGASGWINTPPLSAETLRGKVVLVDFWTYSCVNCLRALPYVKAWAAKYRDHGLVVIGVHTPEFAFEKDPANVARAVRGLGIDYPVALDARYAVWSAFGNRYWPAHYFIDARGRIRHRHFGEGAYAESEDVIRRLLTEAGQRDLPGGHVADRGRGVEAAPSADPTRSPETWLGHARAMNHVGDRLAPGIDHNYRPARALGTQQWTLAGHWRVEAEHATATAAGSAIAYRFRGRDLNLVLGSATGQPLRFRVLLDGRPPGADHGVDVDTEGRGTLDGARMYQLIRQRQDSGERVFEIRFDAPGARAYAFTFG